jgi:hypothetical protein
MAAPYNRSFNPVWDFVDLTGQQVDDTYYLFTLYNTIPYLYAPVYMNQSGTPWSNPIQLLANGTLPVNVYWDPEITYRLELRQGPNQSDPLIYLIENYQPIDSGTGPLPPSPGNNSTDNLLTNPQFADIQFNAPFLISTENVTPIAPGWEIVTTGIGSLTISQQALPGSTNLPGNPSYYLSIRNNDFITVSLRQTFQRNGALWTGEYAAISFLVNPTSPTEIKAYLSYSDTVQRTSNIIDNIFPVGWSPITGVSGLIDESTNTFTGNAAFTTLNIDWSGNTTVNITNLQLIGQDVADDTITYAQVPIERQIDHEFHYYFPQLAYKPIPSYLVAWDFPLNPCQALGPTGVTSSASSYYVADQTILFQTVASNFTMTKNTRGLSFTSAAPSTFALIQYLDGTTPVELLQQRMSALLQGFVNTGAITATVNLVWTQNSSLPDLNTGASVVTSVTSSSGVPVTAYASGWNPVLRKLGAAQCQLTPTSSINTFTGFDSTAVSNITNAKFFAFVISFDTAAASQVITVSRASLNGGDIATLPAPQTPDEVLRECQYYYEQSYGLGITHGAHTENMLMATQGIYGSGTTVSLITKSWGIQYLTVKRTTPALLLYNEAGTSGNVTGHIQSAGIGINNGSLSAANWTVTNAGQKSVVLVNVNGSISLLQAASVGTIAIDGYITYHYTADARLGLVV